MEKLSIVLKKLREDKNLTIEELAKKANVGKGTVGDIETGKSKSTVKTLNKISTALSLDKKEKDRLFSAFLGREVGETEDERIENLTKRERLQYDDFMNDAVLYFQDERVSEEDKQKLFDSLQEAFFAIKLANKRKK
ncbi:helix-turn-helix domain-containing protein [Fusobacterium ulcerans]|uniref:helix-turn-helix domain-containing protein n=1 Tax=Fusobacterium ulcerans TaxID=861 RepID=UPI00241D58E5|nr:helix-turn-helix transcriptional regulator [Fusobacterium ulcerans]